MTNIPENLQLSADDHHKTSSTDYSIEDFAAHMEMPPEDLENLFRTFIEEFDSELSALKSAYEARDYKRMYSIAHNTKGIAANLEMADLFDSCKILNDILKPLVSESPSEPLFQQNLIREIEYRYDQVKGILLEYYLDLNA